MNKIGKILQENRGQTLLEALIALSVIVIVLGATSVAVVTSLNNSTFIKQQNQANKLAQQGSEYIRSQITGGDQFTTYIGYNGTTKCLDVNNVFQSRNCDCSNVNDCINGLFKREVTFKSADCTTDAIDDFADGLQIKTSVYWKSGKCTGGTFCHKQEITSCFINPSKAVPVAAPVGI